MCLFIHLASLATGLLCPRRNLGPGMGTATGVRMSVANYDRVPSRPCSVAGSVVYLRWKGLESWSRSLCGRLWGLADCEEP